ncbi:MAG: hypothetical protein P9M12_07025 [Candidatus Aceula lacicola]|nr:hypothetical protein [Candidatus Aceula lacicola]
MAAAITEMSTKREKANDVRLDRLVLPTLYGEGEDFFSGVLTLQRQVVWHTLHLRQQRSLVKME